ncbi:MAG: DUF1365 domain-containing protein [Gammaproteobacteria bacterium]|nr:DUF1365 domain-containing protein [Gammaproteobacteria bacterium]
MNSCIYAGWIRHRRFTPVANAFRYRLFMVYLDLAELDCVFAGRWLWSTRRPAIARFRRSDHCGEADTPLDESIRDLVARQTGRRPTGPIRLLTHLRYFGYCFNPVSFYYCFGRDGAVEHVVMEVNNTPWGEMHCYVLPRHGTSTGDAMKFDFDKAFHVSPFLPMDMTYRSRVTVPAERLFVALENWKDGRKVFDAHLALDRRPITHAMLALQLAMDPLITLRVIALIMWQAAKLWWKRAPCYSRADAASAADAGTRP